MQGAKVIGIVGGGQLGRMLTLAAKPLGFHVVVVNPSPHSPAAQVGAEEIVADLYDPVALKKLAKLSDYVTVEIEHLNAAVLQAISRTGKPVNPAPATVRLIQDKLAQKQFLRDSKIPVADFGEIGDDISAAKLLEKFGGKMIVKTRQGGYDGRGNVVVSSPAELKRCLTKFGDQPLYAERLVAFTKELAVMVARDMSGGVLTYPLVETIHARNICLEVQAPADVSPAVHKKALLLAKRVAQKLEGAGVYGIEMFLTADGTILVNEIAPRVHNSGHYTMDACTVSQFEQHIRAVSGLPLATAGLTAPAAVMINILGERNGPTRLKGLDKALAIPGVSVHLYGKSPTKIDRKMGHLTATGQTLKQARQRARQARKELSI